VLVPSPSDFILSFLEQLQDSTNLAVGGAEVLIELDLRFHPELRFCLCRLDMDGHPGFFPGEEEDPDSTLSKYGRAHTTERLTACGSVTVRIFDAAWN
jgi:hypothetical protein